MPIQGRDVPSAFLGQSLGEPLSRENPLLTRFAGLSVPLSLVAICLLRAFDTGTAYESPRLLLGLNLVFGSLVSLIVAFLVGRGFLVRGLPGLLLFGCGVLIWGASGLMATITGLNRLGAERLDPNMLTVVHNTCVWVAALCHLAGVVLARRLDLSLGARPLWLMLAYGLALAAVCLVAWLALIGWFPTFLMPGEGGTPVRHFVLGSAISLFVLTALFLGIPGASRSAFAYWYSLALLLLAVGLFGVMIQKVPGSLVGWAGRMAQYVAGTFMLVAAVSALREAGGGRSLSHALDDSLGPVPGASLTRAHYPYFVAFVLVVSATALRLAFLDGLGTRVSYLTFYPAVVLAALYGGLRAGLLAAVLSELLARWFWIEPTGSLAVPEFADALGMAVFFLSCFLISWTAEAMHRAQARAVAAETQAGFAAERAEAAQAVQESLDRLALGIQVSGIALADVDYRDGTIHLSPEAARLFGLGEQPMRVPRALVHARFHPQDKGELERRIAGCLDPSGPGSFAMDHRILLEDGQVRWLSVRKRVVFDRSGAVPRALSAMLAAQDITERKQAEDALRASEERLQTVLQASAMGTFEVDLQSGETRWNVVEYQLLGLEPGAAPADPGTFIRHVHPDDLESVQASWAEAQQTGRLDIETRILRADGEERWLAGKGRFAAILRDGTADSPGNEARQRFLGVNFDITERKQAEAVLSRQADRLQEQAEQLREADRRKDELLAMLGHELRNPLTPISVAAEMLELKGAEDPALVQWAAATVKHQAQNLTRLVDDLLDASRVTQGKIALSRTTVDLGALLGRALEAGKPQMEERRHALDVDPCDQPLTIDGDPLRLEQVIGNLLGNAAKYTPEGGLIRVSLAREGRLAILRVKDNGIGISPTMLPKVCGLFVQAEGTRDRADGGLGIGLALVKSLVEMHGGAVEVQSPGIGQGTEVTVRLPLGNTAAAAQSDRAAPWTGDHPPRYVLVVDDNDQVRASLEVLIKALGHRVRVASNGQEALDLAQTEAPDTMLVDIGMPGLDGYQVARRIRQDPELRGVKLIAMTGYGQSEDREESERAGFDRHLVKPFDPQVLAEALVET